MNIKNSIGLIDTECAFALLLYDFSNFDHAVEDEAVDVDIIKRSIWNLLSKFNSDIVKGHERRSLNNSYSSGGNIKKTVL